MQSAPAPARMELEGLAASLAEMALRCASIAIAAPVLVLAAWWAAGRGDVRADDRAPFAALMATFMLVPMLALTAALSATIAVGATLRAPWPLRRRLLRGGFIAAAAAWALVVAYWHVAVIVPAVTG